MLLPAAPDMPPPAGIHGTALAKPVSMKKPATVIGSVVLAGRREEPLESARAEIEASGAACLAVPADVREPGEPERIVDAAIDRFGHVDVLVNNAGGQFTAPAEEISDKGWRAVHRLSVDAVWSVTRTVATRSMFGDRSERVGRRRSRQHSTATPASVIHPNG